MSILCSIYVDIWPTMGRHFDIICRYIAYNMALIGRHLVLNIDTRFIILYIWPTFMVLGGLQLVDIWSITWRHLVDNFTHGLQWPLGHMPLADTTSSRSCRRSKNYIGYVATWASWYDNKGESTFLYKPTALPATSYPLFVSYNQSSLNIQYNIDSERPESRWESSLDSKRNRG